ncbi:hypothetical protein PSEUBRA_006154 [Kalmanozyma brasiliensis GHG001]|uniref:Uncharacterized protein n=1 Tax=Kalmanozyma brasiliensis (strain GHG001) TaxID=1365824 RepID=V5ESF3_KALBG|nr:uncharacterized protein PSEUBRA_006154 [Kalmanozyma brasiliensis GHG001]EST04839.1 hypothetical protein PSEUBRA_006154 [Kalmanozyma brasiliensis GHG001]
MKTFDPSSSSSALVLGLVAASLASIPSANADITQRPSNLHRRQAASRARGNTADQIAIYQQAFTDPVGAAQAANALPFIANQFATGSLPEYNLAEDAAQLPWNTNVPFVPEAAVDGSDAGGWQALPTIDGMTLNRTFAVRPGVTMPFYQSSGYDSNRVKRAVMIMPGKPRDCWKYTSLVQNALEVYITNPASAGSNADGSSSGGERTSKDDVLILGPCWMNTNDREAGAIQDGELYWYRGQWQSGMASRGPGDTALSSYQVMDSFMDTLFDKSQFPALETVVVAGHSLGAQMAQRYAVAKQPASYDTNISFWIGNPGSYAWLSPSRPNQNNASCADEYDDWPHGLSGTGLPPYARERVRDDKQQIVNAFLSRNVHYSLGLLDNGRGDTSCPGSYQGANHLERGAHFVEAVADLAGGRLPRTHSANFMPNVSHNDYSMLSYNISLFRLFEETPVGAVGSSSNMNGGARGNSTTNAQGNSGNTSPASSYKAGGLAAGAVAALAFGMSLL